MRQLIARILEETDYAHNPYFVALRDGSFSKEDFVETQIQFFYAVVFFGRPMAALAARIGDDRLRTEVLRNVWEEHGEGGRGLSHGRSFLTLLDRLAGVSLEDCEARALWPSVRLFNTTLTGACVLDEHLVGVGVMGIIERMFSEISGWIGRGIVERGWLTEDQLIHYDLHEELDIRHAEDFFVVLDQGWARSAADRYYIEQGLRLGALLFDNFYRDLYRARTTRLRREVRVPHVRT